MRRTIIPALLLTSLLCTCAPPPPTPLPELGTGTEVVVYDDPEAIAGLWRQDNDTTFVLNFWATWCAPCREELPLLQTLATDNADQPLRVILVSLDDPNNLPRVRETLGELAPTLPGVVLTQSGGEWAAEFDRAWSGNLPTTLIYRGSRRYVYRRAFNTYLDLAAAADPLLKNGR